MILLPSAIFNSRMSNKLGTRITSAEVLTNMARLMSISMTSIIAEAVMNEWNKVKMRKPVINEKPWPINDLAGWSRQNKCNARLITIGNIIVSRLWRSTEGAHVVNMWWISSVEPILTRFEVSPSNWSGSSPFAISVSLDWIVLLHYHDLNITAAVFYLFSWAHAIRDS